MSLDWIYYAISWILLRWHSLWDAIGIPDDRVLGTNWSWVLSIFFLVVTLRVILFPVFVKQIKSQRAMQALQPKVKALQEKHKGDRETLQKEMMELYKTEKANPLMGCLPMFLQVPVFIGLFHVLRHLNPNLPEHLKTIYGWKLEQFNSATAAHLFNVPISAKFGSTPAELAAMHANGTTVKVLAGVLILVMMGTTFLTSRQMILKTGWAEDPQQKMVQRLMLYGIPCSLLISGSLFPIGVVIYWVTNNLFTLGQQQWVLRKFPPPNMAGKGGATTARPANATASDVKNPVQPGRSGGLFGRKAVAEEATPVVDTKALAPKPGAKPVNPKKGARPANKPKG
ncbi:membrane protein [Actinoplanes sp. SE50]|uniref:membrane protein insertase YidC n=1 Tax=unclassified Actinoplanes TaxID=2626549 RepID=UPI00023EDE27|nr:MULTISPECIES: membrane protein insertase YidC [unclassified Actinoplanes]AEV89259.1 preprotein translocase subunit YidC [Actinoplanes sp. SE50/110]ATO87665.1 membrane protein [Actinoplanes sp. SE50]SLM05084.1 membrane protein [Actinoplanes sp. SE50/110]